MPIFLHRMKKKEKLHKILDVEYFSDMKATSLFLFNPLKLAIIVIGDYYSLIAIFIN